MQETTTVESTNNPSQIHFSRKERREMKKGKSSKINQIKNILKSTKSISSSMKEYSDILEENKEEQTTEQKEEISKQIEDLNISLFNFYKSVDEKEMIREKAYIADIKATNSRLGIYNVKVNRLGQYRAAKKLAVATEEDLKDIIELNPDQINENRLYVIETLGKYKHANFYHPSVLDFSKAIFEGEENIEEKVNILKTCVFAYLSNINIRGNEEFITRIMINFRYLKFYKKDCTSTYINEFVSSCHTLLNKFLELKV